MNTNGGHDNVINSKNGGSPLRPFEMDGALDLGPDVTCQIKENHVPLCRMIYS